MVTVGINFRRISTVTSATNSAVLRTRWKFEAVYIMSLKKKEQEGCMG